MNQCYRIDGEPVRLPGTMGGVNSFNDSKRLYGEIPHPLKIVHLPINVLAKIFNIQNDDLYITKFPLKGKDE